MRVWAPKETWPGERRVPLVPEAIARLTALGLSVSIEPGLGAPIHVDDAAYLAAGATVEPDRHAAFAQADVVVRVRPPSDDDVATLRAGAIHISFLDPFNRRELVERLARQGVSAICMEMIPRSTLAQKMDALSSQANLGGYAAVLLAAARAQGIFPMMTTAAGTIQPARVFIVGAGVAGLQAIATARRLGARVEAFDTRPEVAEQVQSLGAKFVKIDLGETGSTKDGYAKALTPEQLEKQRLGMAKICAQADVVVTTAQVFGRRAPRIITREMIAGMKPGSVIVDMAVESGGNVEGSVPGQDVDVNGVCILGVENLPGRVPVHASQMYASNVTHLIAHIWDKERKVLQLRLEDDILRGCLVTHEGALRNETLKAHYATT